MKSVGEAMSIGRTFAESLQKALRSMETGLTGLNEIEIPGWHPKPGEPGDPNVIRAALSRPTMHRLRFIAQAMREGLTDDEIHAACKFDPWFLAQIRDIVGAEERVKNDGLPTDRIGWTRLKAMGFADARLSELTGTNAVDVAEARRAVGVSPVYKRIDTCAAEFASDTPYMYSTYEGGGLEQPECESQPTDREKVVILGGGPNRIGQGIEFDYCCVHAAYALKEAGFETIMVNCNPETVSTDYDTSDRLYFEPLTAEDVIELIRTEQKNGVLKGVIVQFGGQTPLNLAHDLEAAGIPILGTTTDAIDLAEDRDRFQGLVTKLGLRQPNNGIAWSAQQAEEIADKIGYPCLIRPSYVLGGRGMEIVHDVDDLRRYISDAVKVSGKNPVLVDVYLEDAIEVDVDVVSDGDQVYVAGVMQHIEEAGVHSGDSACALPPHSLSPPIVAEIGRQAEILARALGVVGLMNAQFAVQNDIVFLIEVNPRASRTVPFVAKATGTPIAKIAARVMAGEVLGDFTLHGPTPPYTAVKESVFPFARFPGVDTLLGPEMRSTGEVMGLDTSFGRAFAKAQMGCGVTLPTEGTVFLSVRDGDKPALIEIAKRLHALGYSLLATRGTAARLQEAGLPVEIVNKVLEGQPHVVDAIINGTVHMMFNTTDGAQAIRDSLSLRRTALVNNIPYYTTVAGARAAVEAIPALQAGRLEATPLQHYLGQTAT